MIRGTAAAIEIMTPWASFVVTIKSAPRSVMKQDAVDMAIMQRSEHNPTNLDTDANVVVSNQATLSKALFFLVWKLKWYMF